MVLIILILNIKVNFQQLSIISCLLEWLSSKRQEMISTDKGVEKRELLCWLGGDINWFSHYGKQYGVSSKKWKKNRTTIWFSSSPSEYLIRKKWTTNLERYFIYFSFYLPTCIYILIFIEALFTIAKIWKKSINRQIKKTWYVNI